MRRTTADYGFQGPDAFFLFAALLLGGVFGLTALQVFRYFFALLVLSSTVGLSLLLLVSSRSYRTALRDHILNLHPPLNSEAVLDIGTGRGLLAIGFARSGCYAVGLDVWSSSDLLRNYPSRALQNAQLEQTEIFLVTGHSSNIPFKETSFDLIVCCDMIHNLHSRERVRKTLSGIGEALVRGGEAIIADLNPFLGPGWSSTNWRNELKKAGFQKIEIDRFGLTTIISGEKA